MRVTDHSDARSPGIITITTLGSCRLQPSSPLSSPLSTVAESDLLRAPSVEDWLVAEADLRRASSVEDWLRPPNEDVDGCMDGNCGGMGHSDDMEIDEDDMMETDMGDGSMEESSAVEMDMDAVEDSVMGRGGDDSMVHGEQLSCRMRPAAHARRLNPVAKWRAPAVSFCVGDSEECRQR